jgi:hypothetical protein
MRLTKLQRRIISDYELLAAPLKIDTAQLPEVAIDRTTQLELIFQEWVRGQVVVKYTLIDEYLSVIIVNYYFPKLTIGHYGKLWRTKKFRLFNYYVLDELYLPKKKDLVNAIRPLPAGIGGRIMKINDVRNAVAHSFFPQNRRRYRKQGGLLYDGADLFTNGPACESRAGLAALEGHGAEQSGAGVNARCIFRPLRYSGGALV